MSVRVPDRKPSALQYMATSMQLRDYITISMCRFSPKYREYLLYKISDAAWECHRQCVFADSLSDSVIAELTQQRICLYAALSYCEAIDSAQTLLFKKIRQNPENFDRYIKMPSERRINLIAEFLETIAGTLIALKQQIMERISIVDILIASLQV